MQCNVLETEYVPLQAYKSWQYCSEETIRER
jgi:hypothetical protein